MIVAISGASGLVGSALKPKLAAAGHEVRDIVRGEKRRDGDIQWDPIKGEIDRDALRQVDAVIHLAGENIGAGRWSEERKRRIRDSRVRGTGLLAYAMSEMTDGPRVLVCASAVGFYGNRGDERLDESSARGEGFLPDVCAEWENAARSARDAGTRVVHLRSGIVLSTDGGALSQMLPPFRFGVGGILGDGQQWMSWIDIEDAAAIYQWALEDESAAGIYNAVSPEPLRNAAFTRVLGKVLRRPTILPLPAFMVKLMFGEMGEKLLLEGQRVEPRRLLDAGFPFHSPDLEGALRRVLG